jgi:hypothetical protein
LQRRREAFGDACKAARKEGSSYASAAPLPMGRTGQVTEETAPGSRL